jgi:hypothetical protein
MIVLDNWCENFRDNTKPHREKAGHTQSKIFVPDSDGVSAKPRRMSDDANRRMLGIGLLIALFETRRKTCCILVRL